MGGYFSKQGQHAASFSSVSTSTHPVYTKLLDIHHREEEDDYEVLDRDLDPKERQAVLDNALRLAIERRKYDIAKLLQSKGASRAMMSRQEAKQHFCDSREAFHHGMKAMMALKGDTLRQIFASECVQDVLFWHLNAILKYMRDCSSLQDFSEFYSEQTRRAEMLAEIADALGKDVLHQTFFVLLELNPVARWGICFNDSNIQNVMSKLRYRNSFVDGKKVYLEKLLAAGADVNAMNGRAFLLACELPMHENILALLLDQKDYIYTKTPGFLFAFEKAIIHANPSLIERFTRVLVREKHKDQEEKT